MNIKNLLTRIFLRRYIDLGKIKKIKERGITPIFSFYDLNSGGKK